MCIDSGVFGLSFRLTQGVSAEDLSGIHSAYYADENGVSAVLSGELIRPVVEEAIKKLAEPVFFFLELPCSEDEERELRKSRSDPFHYGIYYLDGCTLPVAQAIMNRYGDLLVNDGLSRFGFGSHETGEEVYCLNYQNVSVYGKRESYEPIMKKLSVPFEKDYRTLWDNFSQETPGSSAVVEINGETVYDIPKLLKAEGMYLAEIAEEK